MDAMSSNWDRINTSVASYKAGSVVAEFYKDNIDDEFLEELSGLAFIAINELIGPSALSSDVSMAFGIVKCAFLYGKKVGSQKT